ncbi:GTP-binding protein HflX [Virgibacillus subterraneus]|uniref:GTPase HflX n=2 Tax=Virgibacillus TaxID=84406 RepID=A0A1H1C3B7_9BACI|nr:MULTISPECIES: GTPase HflX [Virgibacillus]SDQ58625.1 GTP-binding protein HflX [Virgibacillus salinus]SEQ55744.1 GTP-binding protein HflX [Virgibacillus subterraneus]
MSEKILIIAVKMQEQNDDHFESSLEELSSLCKTAGGKVAKVMTQNRQKIHPAYYIGEGKMEEINEAVDELEINLVVSNDELSAGQLRNLSDRFGVRVIDRSQLILDIFAQRAHTKEGKLQVELAQLEYMLPRLHGQGEAMSRLGAGIGTRGPGETKLETDQRHIRRRIFDIKRRLKLVVQQREQYRKRRKTNDAFQIAIVGYTNAGKSTLFNRLTKSSSHEENQLFATLDPLTRRIQLPSGFQTLVTDTVGFIQDLPTSLVASFKSTLEEVTEADFILHVVDAANPDLDQHQRTVSNLLRDLNAHTIPMLTVYNKYDKIDTDFIAMNHPNILVSAFDQEDIQKLQIKIEEILKDEWDWYKLDLTPDQGKMLNRLEHETIISDRFYEEEQNEYVVEGYMRQEHPLKSLLKE